MGVAGMCYQKKAPGQSEDMLEEIFLSWPGVGGDKKFFILDKEFLKTFQEHWDHIAA